MPLRNANWPSVVRCLVLLWWAVSLAAVTLTAQTLTTLHSFSGRLDGAQPLAGLVRDAAGNLYGATATGGSFDMGTIFKLDTSNHLTVLHSFNGSDGDDPLGTLIMDAAGNLYGTTARGGFHDRDHENGFGVVFELDTSNHLTVLHKFNHMDGATPIAGLVMDAAGNLYGTAEEGNCPNCHFGPGVVFKIDTSNHYTVLHGFGGQQDGVGPRGGLLLDAAGNLYGTTEFGGTPEQTALGTVFKIDTSNHYTLLHSFDRHGPNRPEAGLIMDAAGNLYGTTTEGGGGHGVGSGHGIIFKLDTSNHLTVLHTFSGRDGTSPQGVLTMDAAGILYGTTERGGAHGQGVLFKLDTSNQETVLHSFGGGGGANPIAGPIMDAAGNLYGTTADGGRGAGTVYKLSLP